MNKDLTARDPGSVLWRFCLPLFGSIIFQQLYNIADTLVAGKFIGEQALAAVGNSYEITLIFIAFTFGCNMGCSIIVSRLFGAQKLNDMKTACYTAMIASGVLCLALMLFGWYAVTGCCPSSVPLLRFMQVRASICGFIPWDCRFYFSIISPMVSLLPWGIPGHRFAFWQCPPLPI